jgi:transcriptional regulator with XRE-family HTH domain
MTFGEKLRKYRLEKGWTQAELAQQAGLGVNTISNYEKGKTYPQNREVYTVLARLLDVNPDHLRNENDEFIAAAAAKYGARGARQAEELMEEITGLFAGGELAEEDMDVMMKAIQDAYWIAKERNRKYTPKKYRSGEERDSVRKAAQDAEQNAPLTAARNAARNTARDAARAAARDTARAAARDTARAAARDTARAAARDAARNAADDKHEQ